MAEERTGLLIAVAPRYRYCSGATFTVAVAEASLLLIEKNGDGGAATFSLFFCATFELRQSIFWVSTVLELESEC